MNGKACFHGNHYFSGSTPDYTLLNDSNTENRVSERDMEKTKLYFLWAKM